MTDSTETTEVFISAEGPPVSQLPENYIHDWIEQLPTDPSLFQRAITPYRTVYYNVYIRIMAHNITVVLKQDRRSYMISIGPADEIKHLKGTLLRALRDVSPGGIAGVPIPTSTDEVILGLMRDRTDVSKGWRVLDAGTVGERNGVDPDRRTVQGVGLTDGDYVAFCIRHRDASDIDEPEFHVVFPTYEDELYPAETDSS
ncbi:MAG: hypothetical protein M1833_002163 [Piccolia ochrophora]|nr:MAG: hypothetical protein M1833_002163 [Piccolia ochrophora]